MILRSRCIYAARRLAMTRRGSQTLGSVTGTAAPRFEPALIGDFLCDQAITGLLSRGSQVRALPGALILKEFADSRTRNS
jgi:hypothetical protein